jgi:hypothetical protein
MFEYTLLSPERIECYFNKAQKKYRNNFAKSRASEPHAKGALIRSAIWCISVFERNNRLKHLNNGLKYEIMGS